MVQVIKESLQAQFGAAIDMLENAIKLWPEEHWFTRRKFFYDAYHALILLDYYLTDPPEAFFSPLPFTITDLADVPEGVIGDVAPNEVYSKTQLLDYLQRSREKCDTLIENPTPERLADRWVEEDGDMDYSVLEILLYNMRHVQHHAAQLNLYLRQTTGQAPRWVFRAGNVL